MVELDYCKISKINYAEGTADITIEDREGQVVVGVPFLAGEYKMPGIGDTVAALLSKSNGKIERGIILGPVFSKNNKPVKSGAGVYYKALSDGAYIHYDPKRNILDIRVNEIITDKIRVKAVETEQ